MTPTTATEPAASTPQTSPATPGLDDRVTRALVGAAVGDALGGPVEGWTPEQI
ncbi:ADP-ribosylglycohydrolase family protein, partial [Streptomyces sp. ZEA17I]|uniref:ADP-ribosylglycohydrolase family protein n=2 Tax=Streptomyces TaxID=1883 RepID=UPI0011B5AC7F